MIVVWMVVGALVTLFVAWLFRRVIGPWIAAPVATHIRAELTDLVAVIVLSPEIQADLRDTIEQVVASESRTLLAAVVRLDARVARIESKQESIGAMVATNLDEGRRRRDDPPDAQGPAGGRRSAR